MIISENILKVSGLSKRFYFRQNALSAQFKQKASDEFYAVRDISFELKRGEICGLVGRNGAGKTTLLELLSGIIKPSEGEISIYGKAASVIDIGTGMHRDLSGYENIFLVGELLGMKKSEIEARLPEIIAFSELEQFIHLPVKHYSSGMFMRLAFSVITHLNADILLIDEIIGVGDLAFSEKTTAKIIDICRNGKCAIIATHSLNLVKTCCNTAMYMDRGILISKGTVDNIEELYLEDVLENKSLIGRQQDENSAAKTFKPKLKFENSAESNGNVELIEAVLQNRAGAKEDFSVNDDLKFELSIESKTQRPFILSMHINHRYNEPALCLTPQKAQTTGIGRLTLSTTLPQNILNQGLYNVSVFIVDEENKLINSYENVLIFKIELDDYTREVYGYEGKFSGPVFRGGNWMIDNKDSI